ncbi:MAG: hypothetical protein B7Z37_12185 [Verrucomicrobia bacterium 12-59-8]|nr:MAG: hypothetical protein B7Z37_12185 [Verrucomicrobia bacterium 12-59-8]
MPPKRPPTLRASAALLACCAILHAGIADGQDALRDAAAGTKASLAAPADENVPETKDSEDTFLDEYMNYQMRLLKNWKLRVFASGTWRYDSNVFLRNFNAQHDMLWSARPGFQYSYGDEKAKLQLLADYNAQFNFYDKFSQQNSLNQFLSLSLAYRMQKTSIKLSGIFNQVTGGDLDVGGQAQRINFSPQLQIMYEVSEKVRIGLSGQLQQTHYNSLISSQTWRFGVFADYAFSPRFRLGLQFNEMIQEVQQSSRAPGVRGVQEAFDHGFGRDSHAANGFSGRFHAATGLAWHQVCRRPQNLAVCECLCTGAELPFTRRTVLPV